MHLHTNSSLEQWLGYIESLHPREIDLGLERLSEVGNRLLFSNQRSNQKLDRHETSQQRSDQQKKPFVFTVAGTNGKGTTTASLSALTLASGHTVGWYSSPHMFQFNERIRINGRPASDQQIVNAFCAIEDARLDTSLSYFEYTTLAALWLFSQANVDVWVLEVGLGGRLDAVNIIDSDIAVITNIGIDHTEFLSDDLNTIGFEKAGICRADKPVVLGSENLPDGLWTEIERRDAIAYKFNSNHGVELQSSINDKSSFYWGSNEPRSVASLPVPVENAATALQAFTLSPFNIDSVVAVEALNNIELKGRMQKLVVNKREVILDVGHNPHAANYIASKLKQGQFHILLGILEDKDAIGIVSRLFPKAKSMSFLSLAVPRGISGNALKQKVGLNEAQSFDSMADAMDYFDSQFPMEPLFIGGSFYTVCDALVHLES